MEGYPYIQKVSSPYAAFQDSTSNPDKATDLTGSFEQPVYEQLMPSALVAVNPYCYDAGITSACKNVEVSNLLPETTPCSGTYIIDPYSTAASGNNCTVQSLTSEHPSQYVPPVLNEPQAGGLANANVKHSFSGGETSVCNGTAEDHVKHNPIPVETCLTTLPEQTPECALIRDEQNTVPPNETSTTSMNEVRMNEPSKSMESIVPIEIETKTNACNQQDASAIIDDTCAKEDELHSVSKNSEPDSTTDVQASKAEETTSVGEKPLESDPAVDDDENSRDSVKSDSGSETPHSENVSSLFKNVVLVQADSIMVEETDSCGGSASDVQALNDTETVDPIVTSSVEDIGREDESMENDLLDPAGLLIDETGDHFEILEGVAVGKMGQIVALDAPLIDPNDVMEEPENDHDKEILKEEKNSNGTHVSVQKSKPMDTVSLSSDDETSEGRTMSSQKCQMRKRGVIRVVNVEKELLNAKKKKSKVSEGGAANDDPFGSCESSSSDDVPNDMYFGSKDRVFTVSTKLHWQRQKQKRNKYYARGKTTDPCEDASSDNDDEEHTQRRAKKAEEIARLKLPAYQQQQLQQLVLKKHPKRDRFYDRSQDIPNDIYFGNVNVPLHILHATSSSSSDEEPWPGGNAKSSTNCNHRKESTAYTKSSNHRYSRSSSSRAESTSAQGSVRSVQRMKEYLKMTGFRHMRYQKLWQGCETNHERAEAILRFLQAHGLQGEPTDEKCRELRKQIQLQKEVEVLDTSLIIGSGEGRVTRQRTKKVSETTTAEPRNGINQTQEQKNEQSLESAAPTETTVLGTECVKQPQQQEEQDGNVPSETRIEQSSPAGEYVNSSNPLPNE